MIDMVTEIVLTGIPTRLDIGTIIITNNLLIPNIRPTI